MAELTWDELDDYTGTWVTAEHGRQQRQFAELVAALTRSNLTALTHATAVLAARGDRRRAGQVELLLAEWTRRGFRAEGETIVRASVGALERDSALPRSNAPTLPRKEPAHAHGS